jgi:hypothetical protein
MRRRIIPPRMAQVSRGLHRVQEGGLLVLHAPARQRAGSTVGKTVELEASPGVEA